jgi:hypothetical protein
MRKNFYRGLACAALALAVGLTGCGKSSSSGASSMGTGMSGSTSSGTSYDSQQAAWRTGVGLYVKTSESDRTGTIKTAAAAVLLDGDGKIVQLRVDELESEIVADGSGAITMPESYLTKREQGDSYSAPMAKVSSIGKGWAEQADAFEAYLVGMTYEQVQKLDLNADGYATEVDLLAGCTMKVDSYKEAVLRACAAAEVEGASQGDALCLGMQGAAASGVTNATDDHDGIAGVVVTAIALTKDENDRVTSAQCDEIEPSLTVVSDGGITLPDRGTIQSKNEQGDSYGMKAMSALGKEWYEQAQGYSSYILGKNAAELAKLPTDGSEADLAALCTIDTTDLQKAALKALEA